ncbi:MAG: hypothetical protein ACREI2_05825 [Nitrospiraceae bacterium]
MKEQERFKELDNIVQELRHNIEDHRFYKLYFAPDTDKWDKFCVAMDTLEDTELALAHYFNYGLGRSDEERYLRLYGVQQAVYLQQDAIRALVEVVLEKKFEPSADSAWRAIREVRRHIGHPIEVKKAGSVRRTFLTRVYLAMGLVGLITRDSKKGESEHWGGQLDEVLLAYLAEAIPIVREIGESVKKRWPLPED